MPPSSFVYVTVPSALWGCFQAQRFVRFGLYCQRNPDSPALKRLLALLSEELHTEK